MDEDICELRILLSPDECLCEDPSFRSEEERISCAFQAAGERHGIQDVEVVLIESPALTVKFARFAGTPSRKV